MGDFYADYYAKKERVVSRLRERGTLTRESAVAADSLVEHFRVGADTEAYEVAVRGAEVKTPANPSHIGSAALGTMAAVKGKEARMFEDQDSHNAGAVPEGLVRLTALYTDVHDGVEYRRKLTVDVKPPTQDIDEWAYENLRPHTGTGERLSGDEAGYFVKILHFDAHPELENEEFDWGL